MALRQERLAEQKGEIGYSWLYKASVENGGVRVLVTILGIALAIGVFVWYSRTNSDAAPDSQLGLIYATIGTVLMLLAATSFSKRRRAYRGRKLGGLRASLGWHMCFGMIGLVFLCLHSFGEFNPRSGTYALYGMIALVISGLIGRFLDRLMPRMVAGEAHQALTAQGEDRIEAVSQKLQAIVVHNTQDVRGFASPGNTPRANGRGLATMQQGNARSGREKRDQGMRTPWDLAYISLESTPQELGRDEGSFRLVPDRKSELLRPGALMPGTQEPMSELEEVRHAMRQELFYRYITRYWRKFHIFLALLTVGLLIWHLVFALQLTIPLYIH